MRLFRDLHRALPAPCLLLSLLALSVSSASAQTLALDSAASARLSREAASPLRAILEAGKLAPRAKIETPAPQQPLRSARAEPRPVNTTLNTAPAASARSADATPMP